MTVVPQEVDSVHVGWPCCRCQVILPCSRKSFCSLVSTGLSSSGIENTTYNSNYFSTCENPKKRSTLRCTHLGLFILTLTHTPSSKQDHVKLSKGLTAFRYSPWVPNSDFCLFTQLGAASVMALRAQGSHF